MPSVSEKQHRAMEAAAYGKSNLGIPKKVGEEFVSKDAKASTLRQMVKVLEQVSRCRLARDATHDPENGQFASGTEGAAYHTTKAKEHESISARHHAASEDAPRNRDNKHWTASRVHMMAKEAHEHAAAQHAKGKGTRKAGSAKLNSSQRAHAISMIANRFTERAQKK